MVRPSVMALLTIIYSSEHGLLVKTMFHNRMKTFVLYLSLTNLVISLRDIE